jgi:hypothetical protein
MLLGIVLAASACEIAEPVDTNPASVVGTSTIVAAAESTVASSPPETTIPRPTLLIQVVTPDGEPLSGAAVGPAGLTGRDGYVTVEVPGSGLAIRAPGYVPRYVGGRLDGEIVAVLQPIVVEGVVRTSAGVGLAEVGVTLGEDRTVTDEEGRFRFVAATGETLGAQRPAWRPMEVEWLGLDSWVELTLEPFTARALHVSGWAVGDPDHWRRLLDLAATTEVNALVVDLKDESGRVFYPSEVELAVRVDATRDEYLLDDVVAQAEQQGFYLIGRIVTFQDPIAARAAPDLAVWNTSTGGPYEKRGQYFLDPTDPVARRYALDLAVEACLAGFDEIQFDYVRYPDGFGSSAVFDGGTGAESRPAVIRDFLAEATSLLRPEGCAVAADIFGFITSTTGDGGIGQQLEQLADVVDVLSPMLYPSHYSEGWFGFEVPNDHPGPVVAAALDDGLARITTPVVLRPWVQDFFYNSSQVRAEIDQAEERDLGWMLWNVLSRFSEGALLPADGE